MIARAAIALVLLLAGLVARSELPAESASVNVEIGGQSIALPPPPGWVAIDTSGDAARAPFTRFISRTERVLAGFAPSLDGGQALTGESLMKLALAASAVPLESEEISPARFKEILAQFREDMPEAEVLLQDSDALGTLILMQAQTESGDPLPEYASATLMLFARVKGRFVRLGMFDFTASADSAAVFKATAIGWLAAIRAANCGPAQPEM